MNLKEAIIFALNGGKITRENNADSFDNCVFVYWNDGFYDKANRVYTFSGHDDYKWQEYIDPDEYSYLGDLLKDNISECVIKKMSGEQFYVNCNGVILNTPSCSGEPALLQASWFTEKEWKVL